MILLPRIWTAESQSNRDQLRPLNRDGLLGLDLDETGVGDGGVVAGRGDGDDLLGPGPVVQLDHGPVRRRVGEVVRGLAVLGEGVLGDGREALGFGRHLLLFHLSLNLKCTGGLGDPAPTPGPGAVSGR